MLGYSWDNNRVPLPPEEVDSLYIRNKYWREPTRSNIVKQALPGHYIGAAYPTPDFGDTRLKIAGMLKRIGQKPKPFNLRKVIWMRSFIDDWLEENLTPLDPNADISFETWIKSRPYTESRKMELRKCYEVVSSVDYDKRWERVNSFIKEESYPEYKLPRGIYSRTDFSKVVFGPLISACESVLFKFPSFIKKIPVSQRPDYITKLFEKASGNVYDCDITSLENSFTPTNLHTYGFRFLRYMVKQHPEAKIIAEIFISALSSPDTLVFSDVTVVSGCRQRSGCPSTSAFNGFACLMLVLGICKYLGYGVCSINEGDDAVFQTLATVTTEHYEWFGFQAKLNVNDHISKAGFCGLIFDTKTNTIVIDAIKYILKTNWTNQRDVLLSKRKCYQALKAKLLSLLWLAPRCPIIKEFALSQLKLVCGYAARFDAADFFSLSPQDKDDLKLVAKETNYAKLISRIPGLTEIDLDTRLVYEQKFTISVNEQLILEDFFKNKNDLKPYCHPLIDHYTNSDQQHFYETHTFTSPKLKMEQMRMINSLPNTKVKEYIDELIDRGRSNFDLQFGSSAASKFYLSKFY